MRNEIIIFAVETLIQIRDYIDMIGEKWLAKVMFTTVESKADISKVKEGANGDFRTGDLSKAVNIAQINEVTVRAWLARAESRKSTLVFGVDLAHVADLTETFRQHGVDARYITSQTPNQIRSERLDDFKDRKFPVLLNCGVFTEGTDIPNIDCVLLARPTKSRNLLVQMIGRGMRLFPGKEDCHVIDMVASLQTGIITTPSLFGLDPSELVKEATVDQLQEMKKPQPGEIQRKEMEDNCHPDPALQEQRPDRRIVFTDYTDIRDLILDTSGERHIRAVSSCYWVQVDTERWVLNMLEGAYATIERTEATHPLYIIRHTARVPGNPSATEKWKPYMRPRQVATASTFTDAVHAADTFVLNTCPRYIVATDQAWRHRPATDSQLKFLSKLKLDLKTPITKGRAIDMITKVKFGALGHMERAQAMRRRNERKYEKVVRNEALRQREEVRIGPLNN